MLQQNMNTPMSVEQIKMTGAELKRVKERAGIKEADIKERLGIEPPTYYNYTNKKNRDKEIPLEVEDRIEKDDDLREAKNRELSGPKPDQMEVVVKSLSAYGDLAGAVTKMMDVISTLALKSESKYEDLKKNNDAVLKNNDAILGFMESVMKEGEFRFHKKTA